MRAEILKNLFILVKAQVFTHRLDIDIHYKKGWAQSIFLAISDFDTRFSYIVNQTKTFTI